MRVTNKKLPAFSAWMMAGVALAALGVSAISVSGAEAAARRHRTPATPNATAAAAAPSVAPTPTAAATNVTLNLSQTGPQISKYIYGQFAEQLGTGINGGIWVGRDSTIANTNGFRTDVVNALKELHVPLVRWPGGCYADIYHWRDGIGPYDRRAARVNSSWDGLPERHGFGTHEFFDFAELIGADAYLNINLGTGSPQEMRDWIEYITGTGESDLVRERRANGRAQPWHIKYLAIGNETWGCGGNMRSQYYGDLYAHWATFLNLPAGTVRVASGGHGGLLSYNHDLLRNPNAAPLFDAISFHQYSLPTGNWDHKGAALGFPESEWMSLLQQVRHLEALVRTSITDMDEADPTKRVALAVDEWGTWYDREPGATVLWQQNSMRDAVVAAMHLNFFHSVADRVRMANIAQMVNVLQAMILTDGPRMVLTPTYHVFHMYKPFQDATAVPLNVQSPDYVLGDSRTPMVSATAARTADGALVIGLTNMDPNNAAPVRINVGTGFGQISGQILTASTMDAHNDFDHPNAVAPAAHNNVRIVDGVLTDTLPSKSVVVLVLRR